MKSAQATNLASELEALDAKVNAFLPARYQHCYTSVSPNSMGSAGLSYGRDGKVAWDQIWTTFCELALAGGPPHRGKLLEPVSEAEVQADLGRYEEVVSEIKRAIRMTTCLSVTSGYELGWVGVECESVAEAAWLQFAITAENVSARRREAVLQLPAGPAFREEKEIKNVVVALAKASHYWDGHLTATQQTLPGSDVREPATPSEAAANISEYTKAMAVVEEGLHGAGLSMASDRYVGWVGIETAGEEESVWLLRAVLAEQMLARREDKAIYLPIAAAPRSEELVRIVQVFDLARQLWKASTSPRRTQRQSRPSA